MYESVRRVKMSKDEYFKRAENDTHRLTIKHDSDADSPRDWDNLSTMVCWHKRYNLGDKHDYDDSNEFLQALCRELPQEKLIEYSLADPSSNFKLTKTEGGYNLKECLKEGHVSDEFNFTNEEKSDLFDCLLDVYRRNDFIAYLEENDFIILPLFLYDHSGITINTTGFSCQWDSGQVGYCYVSPKTIEKEYGAVTAENKETAKKVALGEVETYDQYLTGDVYGFVLEEKYICASCGKVEYNEIESCWGFFGDDCEKNGIKDNLSEEYHALIKELK
jgi:hypothetical protein